MRRADCINRGYDYFRRPEMLSPETRQSTKRRSEAASLSELLTPNKAFANRPSKRASKRRTPAKGRLASHPRRILVVDDVPDVTEMIALFLKHAGFDVTTANSADSALHLSSENQFDLIISDIGMPEMNGYDLVESLRTREAYQHTPMIAVTGYTEYDDRGRSLRSGFNAHLTKPINPSDLLSVIGELLA